MASFPRPGGFGSSWASWPSGARMGLVSSSDMAATEVKYQCKWGESRIQTGREYIQSMRNPSLIPQPALLLCYSFYAFTLAILQTFSAQLQGWPETACLVHSLGITSTMPRLSEIHCSDSKDLCRPNNWTECRHPIDDFHVFDCGARTIDFQAPDLDQGLTRART